MKTKIQIKPINDNDICVAINSNEHRIEEIKKEIKECFTCTNYCPAEAEVWDMWKN